MKFLKFSFSLLLLSFLFTSCGDDELLSESIIGVWDLVSGEVIDCQDPDELVPLTVADSNNCITVQGDTSCNFNLTFTEDGTVLVSFAANGDIVTDDDSTFTVDDETNTGLICEDGVCNSIAVEDNTLTFTEIEELGGCTTILVLERR